MIYLPILRSSLCCSCDENKQGNYKIYTPIRLSKFIICENCVSQGYHNNVFCKYQFEKGMYFDYNIHFKNNKILNSSENNILYYLKSLSKECITFNELNYKINKDYPNLHFVNPIKFSTDYYISLNTEGFNLYWKKSLKFDGRLLL